MERAEKRTQRKTPYMKSDSSNENINTSSGDPEREIMYEETVVATYEHDELIDVSPERRAGGRQVCRAA